MSNLGCILIVFVSLALGTINSVYSQQYFNNEIVKTTYSEQKSCPVECLLPKDEGIYPCWYRSKTRWYFNANTERCQAFQYSPCYPGGNENRFKRYRQCENRCSPCSSSGNDVEVNERKLHNYRHCMERHGVPYHQIVDPSSNGSYYQVVNFQWNHWFQHTYPVAYFLPSNAQDVQNTVHCGFEAGIQLVPNSGAHSYSSLSFGNNHSIIVDFRNMKSIAINEEENTVTIQPGALLGAVNVHLWKNGGYGIPAGNCMTVGMGGHGIGGGIGYYAGLYGLNLDNLVEIKMVDARGNALTVNKHSHPDLWWAMRGVGPGYIGIVTSYKVKMFQADKINLTFARLRYAISDFAEVMTAYYKWLAWVKENDPTVFTVVFVVSDHFNATIQPLWPGIEVQLLHIQDKKVQPNSNATFLEGFPKIFPHTPNVLLAYPNYMDFVLATGYAPVVVPVPGTELRSEPNMVAMGRFDDPIITQGIEAGLHDDHMDFISKLTKEMAWPRYFKAKSFYVKKPAENEGLKRVQEVLLRIPKDTMGLMITSEQGAIGRPDKNAMAYVHRDFLNNIRVHYEGVDPNDVPEGKAWLKEFWNVTRFWDGGQTYQNYPDIEITDYLERHYGSNLQKLKKIKRSWDPEGYFNSSMSIPIH